MTFEAGTPRGSKLYLIVVTAVCLILSAYFFYHGGLTHPWFNLPWDTSYPQRNIDAALVQLTGIVPGRPTFGEHPQDEDYRALLAAKPATRQEVQERMGTPAHSATAADGTTTDYYVSLYGLVRATSAGGRLVENGLSWTPWGKSKSEMTVQIWCGIASGLIGLFFAYKAFRAAQLRVVVDDTGMTYDGRRIEFAAVRALTGYNPKGWIDVEHEQGGTVARLRLDNQRVERFDDIVAAICAARGFPNPIAPKTSTD